LRPDAITRAGLQLNAAFAECRAPAFIPTSLAVVLAFPLASGRPGKRRRFVERKCMRRRDVLGLIAGAALPWPLPVRANQALLDEAVGFTGQVLFLAAKTPALVLGVVRNGQTSIQGFGRRAEGSSDAPAADSLLRIGSITKVFTGQVLASLAADGLVSLADPLTKYVPEFIAPMSEGGRPIRLIDLATHSAGLPRELPHEPGPPDDPFVNITREGFVAWLKANPLLFTPGTSVLYSNLGFDLLAAALAAAARQPYPELLDARVMRPLGLADTTFVPSAGQAGRLCQGHDFEGAPLPNVPTGSVIVGSGGLYSTPRDLLSWLQWHLDRFSNERAAERLIDHAAYLWRDGLNSVYGMDESGQMDAIGLGWVIMEAQGRRPLILQKAGGLQGVFSYVAFAPARDIGVFVAINAFDFAAASAMAKAANDLIAELAPR
jgi:serine-type D-Ala-D-Ala carboxypeptidase/endopeptidase